MIKIGKENNEFEVKWEDKTGTEEKGWKNQPMMEAFIVPRGSKYRSEVGDEKRRRKTEILLGELRGNTWEFKIKIKIKKNILHTRCLFFRSKTQKKYFTLFFYFFISPFAINFWKLFFGVYINEWILKIKFCKINDFECETISIPIQIV